MNALVKLSRNLTTKTALIAGIALLMSALTAPQVASAAGQSTISCSISGSVTISDAVVTSGFGCAGSVSIPSGITTIRNSAFGANRTLTSIKFPASLTLIENSAFGAAANLRSISFEGNAPTVENSAFGAVANDAKVYITSAANGFGTLPGTWNSLTLAFQPDASGNGAVPCSISGFVTVVNHVATGETSCAGSLTLPDVVTSIGANAFGSNGVLTSVNMPRVTTIGDYAFFLNEHLTSVSIPLATTVGTFAFALNTALASVTMPQVTTLGSGAFSQNTSLTNLSLPSATTIGYGAFWKNTSLANVSIPSVMTIGDIAFEDSSALVRVEFAGNAPTVGLNAFRGVALGATANITYPATGFGAGPSWNGLQISRAAAPYVEPIAVPVVPSISVTGISGSGGSRTITGTLLSTVTSVVVQGAPVSMSNQSDGSLTFTVPKLAAGRYDILISGTSGQLTWQEGLVVVLEAPPVFKNVNLNIFGFTANSAKLTSGAKATINRAISSVSATSIKCAQGASKNRLSATQQKLSISRAKAVCAYAASRAPQAKRSLSSQIFQRVGAPTSFVRLSIQGQ